MAKADQDVREKLIGLGERSIQKSYYPELKSRLRELERFRFLLDQANDFIFLLESPSLLFRDVNETALQSLGYSRERFLSLSLEDVVPQTARPAMAALARRAEREEAGVQAVISLATAEGREIPVEIRLRFQSGPEGKAGIVVARDIGERLAHEAGLRSLRQLLSNIVNSMPSVLICVDAEGRVIQWNQEARRLTGLTENQALGRPLEEVVPALAKEAREIELAMRQRTPRKDNRASWARPEGRGFADVTIYPLVENGVGGAVILVNDVTERVRLEEMMIQSEKMLSVGGLAAGMAHEINNPLAVILGNAQVAVNRLTAPIERNAFAAAACGFSMEDLRRYAEERGVLKLLEGVSEAGRRAARIVENMLSFSRLSEMRFEFTGLSELLDRTLELAASDYDLKKNYDFKSVEIVKDYDPNLPPVPCDSGKIQQVFLNLLKNGAQAMAEKAYRAGGPRFVLRTAVAGDMARVEIEDNGPGMEESVRKRIFEPFFTTKSVGFGSGLGLSVSYFIVNENHGGALSVSSTPGQGSRFRIELPLRR